ncbi:MAG: precorrin-8X methylmutase [Methanosarcinales archaeon]|nr:MAG: precorrin-8X methylmutase [Methanosarcinales archaeon]
MPGTPDLGAVTPQAREISSKSRNIARGIVGDAGYHDRVRQRCVIATGDPEFASLLRFKNDPVRVGIDAIQHNSAIYTDIRMVSVGISKVGHDCPVTCVLDLAAGKDFVDRYGATRTSAGFMALGRDLDSSIIVIGNAPSAALTVCELIKDGVCPALVIGIPVGFVNAAESKEMLRSIDIPSITCVGTRGGTPVAVACMNELIAITAQGVLSGEDNAE